MNNDDSMSLGTVMNSYLNRDKAARYRSNLTSGVNLNITTCFINTYYNLS
jgi:hypothetical protein